MNLYACILLTRLSIVTQTDRLCLNCQRMEQSECECPCECPLVSDICTGELDSSEVSQPSCDLFTESNVLFKLPKALTQRVHQ